MSQPHVELFVVRPVLADRPSSVSDNLKGEGGYFDCEMKAYMKYL